jgi:hypothetical protein
MIVAVGTLCVVLAASPTGGEPQCPSGQASCPPAKPKPAALMSPQELAQAHRVGQDALRARVPVYPAASEPAVPVGDMLDAHGVPMNVQSFMTHDSPRAVLDWYRAELGKMHLPMLGDGDLIRRFPYPSLTVFDQMNGVDLSVICIPDSSSHQTMVLLALSDILTLEHRLGDANRSDYGGLPEYPHGERPSATLMRDGERSATTVMFATLDSAAQVIDFYAKALGQEAYQAHEQPESRPNSRVVDFVAASQLWRVMTSYDEHEGRTQVMATHQTRGAEEGP